MRICRVHSLIGIGVLGGLLVGEPLRLGDSPAGPAVVDKTQKTQEALKGYASKEKKAFGKVTVPPELQASVKALADWARRQTRLPAEVRQALQSGPSFSGRLVFLASGGAESLGGFPTTVLGLVQPQEQPAYRVYQVPSSLPGDERRQLVHLALTSRQAWVAVYTAPGDGERVVYVLVVPEPSLQIRGLDFAPGTPQK
jgi:hypothetical protein